MELVPAGAVDAPAGHRAFEIVATGFWNDAMPLVRYRSGDYVIVPAAYSAVDLADVALGLKPVKAIVGRDQEYVVSPRGDILSGLTYAASGVKGVVRVQVFQQEQHEVEVRVVFDPRVGTSGSAELMRNLRTRLPSDMRISIQPVSDVERLPSGKAPFVIRRLPSPLSATGS